MGFGKVPAEVVETPETHRIQKERKETLVCFKFSDKFCVEKHDSCNNTASYFSPPIHLAFYFFT